MYSSFPLLCAVLFLLLGGFIYLRNPRAASNRVFALSCLSTCWWQGCWTILFSIADLQLAKLLARVGYSGIVFIPTTFFHFFVRFTESEKDFRWVRVAYVLTLGFVAAIWTSDLFVTDVHHFAWGYYPRAGPIHVVFLTLLLVLFLRAVVLLLRRLSLTKPNPLLYNQTKYVLLAILAYALASVDFLMNYRLAAFYPPGFVAILVSFGITTYAIVQYRLLDINLVVARTLILVAVYAMVLGIPFGIGQVWKESLVRLLSSAWWFGPVLVSTVLASAGPFLFLYFRHQAEELLLSEQRRYQETLRRASTDMTRIRALPKLLKLIVHILTKTMRVSYAALYLFDQDGKEYVLMAQRDRGKHHAAPRVGAEDPLIMYLRAHKGAVVREEVLLQRQQGASAGLKDLSDQLRQLGGDCVIPSFMHDHLLGFVVLGAKQSGQMYTEDDLKVLMTLANQAALAIENARFYEAEKERQAEMFHTAQLASLGTLAGSMSHQINNRFYVETIVAGSTRAFLQALDATGLPAPAREAMQKAIVAFQKIEDDAIRGGDIVKTLLDFSKPSTPDRITFPEVLAMARDLAQYRVKFDEITFESILANPLPPLQANKNQLTEAFFNLLTNAYDAIREKAEQVQRGALQLAGGQRYQGKIALSATPFVKHGATWLQVVVHDTGIGIRPEILPRLFVPFFTTKATAEKGTGLGLYVIKRIIENHGGTLDVQSTYGEGTTFTIHLPTAGWAAA